MKEALKKMSFLMGAALLTAPALFAQPEQDKNKQKSDYEEIIITRKGSNDAKTVIEINGDKILVNGKPTSEAGDDVKVSRSKVRDVHALTRRTGDSWSTSLDNNSFSGQVFMNANTAMLGVTTSKVDQGAEVESVTKESGAEKAGIKKGDIITKINDQKIDDADDLSAEVRKHKVGDKVSVTYLRDKKESKVNAELTKWKGVSLTGTGSQNFNFNTDDIYRSIPNTPALRYRSYSGLFNNNMKLGLSVQDTDDGKGVKVLDVDDDGNAGKAGLKEDDVITEVDGKAVNSADEIAKLMKESKDKMSVKMKYMRGGKSETVDVKIPRKLKTADL